MYTEYSGTGLPGTRTRYIGISVNLSSFCYCTGYRVLICSTIYRWTSSSTSCGDPDDFDLELLAILPVLFLTNDGGGGGGVRGGFGGNTVGSDSSFLL